MKTFISAIALFTSLAAAGQIFFAPNSDCTGAGEVVTTPSSGVDCSQLPGYTGAVAQQVDGGCSFTVYTDSNCSNNPSTAGLGQCVSVSGGLFYSYSYDC